MPPQTSNPKTQAMAIAATIAPPAVADWPQWRGPDRNAISTETGLLKQWPENGPPLAWRIEDLGGGYSAPSIAAGRLYGLHRVGDHVVQGPQQLRPAAAIAVDPTRSQNITVSWRRSETLDEGFAVKLDGVLAPLKGGVLASP